MKNNEKIPVKVLVSVAENLVRQNVNSACVWFFHQTRLPKGYKKFIKQ